MPADEVWKGPLASQRTFSKTAMQVTMWAKFSRFLKCLYGKFWPPGSHVPNAKPRRLRTLGICRKERDPCLGC